MQQVCVFDTAVFHVASWHSTPRTCAVLVTVAKSIRGYSTSAVAIRVSLIRFDFFFNFQLSLFSFFSGVLVFGALNI